MRGPWVCRAVLNRSRKTIVAMTLGNWTAKGRIEINEAAMRAAAEGVQTIATMRENTPPVDRLLPIYNHRDENRQD